MMARQDEDKDKEYYLSLVFCLIMIGRAMTARQDEDKDKQALIFHWYSA